MHTLGWLHHKRIERARDPVTDSVVTNLHKARWLKTVSGVHSARDHALWGVAEQPVPAPCHTGRCSSEEPGREAAVKPLRARLRSRRWPVVPPQVLKPLGSCKASAPPSSAPASPGAPCRRGGSALNKPPGSPESPSRTQSSGGLWFAGAPLCRESWTRPPSG